MDNVNFTKYFSTERDVYVKNVSDAQVSVMFDTGNGVESFLFSPAKDPVCITQRFPFDVCKRSLDFRKMLSRRPPALMLLSDEEFQAHYVARAQSLGLMKAGPKGQKVPDVDKAINIADEAAQRVLRREPLAEAKAAEPTEEKAEVTVVNEEDVISPRVQHLCQQVSSQLSDQEKMPANQFLAALQEIAHSLKMDDWEYIRAHGTYKSVKNYAKTMVAQLANEQDGK